jgi:hypothetical protein
LAARNASKYNYITAAGRDNKAMSKQRTQRPPTLTKEALNQLVKGYELAMHSAVLLVEENQELCAANEKVEKQKDESRRLFQHEVSLTVEEELQLI